MHMKPEVLQSINTLRDYMKDPECPDALHDIFQDKYSFYVNDMSEFEQAKGLIFLYCTSRYLARTLSRLPRPQIIDLLTVYFMAGINDKASRETAKELLGISKEHLNPLNAELRNLELTVKNPHRTGLDSLNDDLQNLRDYYTRNKKSPMFTIKLERFGITEE